MQFLQTVNQKSNKVVLFGAGSVFGYALNRLKSEGINVVFAVDNNPNLHGKKKEGILIVNPNEIKNTNLPVLITSMYAKDIAIQLEWLGVKNFFDASWMFDYERWKKHFDSNFLNIKKDKIEKVRNLLKDEKSKLIFDGILRYRKILNPKYIIQSEFKDYTHPNVRPEKGDNIIDGGAWHGDSCLYFSKLLNKNCFIYSFEPEKSNYNQLLKTIEENKIGDIVKPIPKGLYNKNTTLHIDNSKENDMQFTVTENTKSGEKIQAVSIDSFVREQKIDRINFIKMDIEGAEYKALLGAKKVISEMKPKLAICVYHNANDLWEIPLLIKKIREDYDLYLGHHSQNLLDTVLYAV